MTKLPKWAFEHAQITKIGLSNSYGEKAIPTAVELVMIATDLKVIWEMSV